MGDRYGYIGVPHPYWLSPYPPASTPTFLTNHPAESYDPMMIPHASYHQTPSYGDDLSWFYPPPGNLGHGGEESCKDSAGGYYPSVESSSSDVPVERQHVPYSSATVSSLADMLIRNSPEPFYLPIPPSGICAPSSYYSGYGTHENVSAAAVSAPPVVPCVRVPSLPESASKTESFSKIRLGDGRSLGGNVNSSHPPVFIQSSLHGAFVEATGHVKPLSKIPDLRDGTVGSASPRSSQPLQVDAKSSSPHQRPDTLVADKGNGVSGSSSKNAIGDLNCDEHDESWNQFVVKADKGNAAQSAFNSKTQSEGSASEDVQASQKKTTLLTDGIKGSSRSNADGVSTGQSPVCDQGDFTSSASSTRVSSVVNALHDISQVLVYECFSNSFLLKPEQLENLDKVVENLTKCLKKITCDKAIAVGDASDPTQAMHVSCPNVVDLNEVPNVVAEDCQGFNVKPLDSFGFKEPVDKDKDKNETNQSIKNILASNFPDGEESHPQTLLYKNLWLETEAALCSTTCLTRYHRIQNETGSLKSQNKEISADASTCIQEPFLNHQKPVSIINKVEQETAKPLIKHGSTCGNNVVTMSHDAPQSSRFNPAPVDAVLSLMSRSFSGGLGQEKHGNFKLGVQILDTIKQESPEENHNDVIDRFQVLKHQETKRKLKSQDSSDPDIGVIEKFQIVKQQETNSKLKSQNCSETSMDDQEDNLEASEMATIGRSSHMSEMLKPREAEQVQKTLNSVDFDSDGDSDFESDSDSDQPRNKTQRCDYLCSGSMMTIGGNSQIETCANTEPSADDIGYESPTSDWEHVLKDD